MCYLVHTLYHKSYCRVRPFQFFIHWLHLPLFFASYSRCALCHEKLLFCLIHTTSGPILHVSHFYPVVSLGSSLQSLARAAWLSIRTRTSMAQSNSSSTGTAATQFNYYP